jgi:RNA polymerase sigma-70 factor (ECF subfamily)
MAGDYANDAAAVDRTAGGDAEALAMLYDRHARHVFSLACRILGDPAEAEEVVQDVFSQVWLQAGRYDPARAPVVAWLLMMTRSRAIDRRRARQASPVADAGRTELPDVADAGVLPDAQVLSADQVGRLRRALRLLPLVQRLPIELAYYEGLSQSEIAEQLEQPLGTVKTRIRLGLQKLREAMQE